MEREPEYTERGFRVWARIADNRSTVLTVQQSSAASDDYTWLFFVEPGYDGGQPHLTLDQVAELHAALGDVLAANGRAEKRTEWSIRLTFPDGDAEEFEPTDEAVARLQAKAPWNTLRRRHVVAGPWEDVPTTAEPLDSSDCRHGCNGDCHESGSDVCTFTCHQEETHHGQ
jgi:hypothetical protein